MLVHWHVSYCTAVRAWRGFILSCTGSSRASVREVNLIVFSWWEVDFVLNETHGNFAGAIIELVFCARKKDAYYIDQQQYRRASPFVDAV